jgi:hypothetical protein
VSGPSAFQQSSAGFRRLAAVVAGLFALSYVGSLHHHALVEHERCDEHGELVHVHAGDASAIDGPLGMPEARGAHDAPVLGWHAADPATGGAHGEHHHCHIHPTSRAAAPGALERGLVAPSPPAKLEAFARAQAPQGRAQLLELAPKTSPPARGAA